jgi:hypothetical protein
MNYQDKITELKRVRGLFKSNYPCGCIKITKGESEIHARVKTQVAYWLLDNDYSIFSEPTFKNNFRADLVAIHKSGISYILEIVNSESKKSIKLKKDNYPLPIIIVNTKDFDYKNFKL